MLLGLPPPRALRFSHAFASKRRAPNASDRWRSARDHGKAKKIERRSPFFSFPPSFAHKFSSSERRLGTRQFLGAEYYVFPRAFEENRNNKRTEIERFYWFIELTQAPVAFGWLNERWGKKTSSPSTFQKSIDTSLWRHIATRLTNQKMSSPYRRENEEAMFWSFNSLADI